ncbi:hypothetical protein BS78_09G062300 [Paspalum vaginatum]|nr:hypothetical protein BS78_09G062300 [Paspalum vaginatum]
MEHTEVLSNVKAQHSHDLKDIEKLWLLLQTISDLHECPCSLSITTLPEATPHEGTPSSLELPASIASRLENHPKILESLSICGTTLTGHLLPVITNGGNNKLPKVTLTRTPVNQDDLKILAKLPKLQCVRLWYVQCNEPMFTFKEDEFRCLEYLLVEGSDLTNITFEDGAARELKKMVLPFTSSGSISGVDRLLKLKELELNRDSPACCYHHLTMPNK